MYMEFNIDYTIVMYVIVGLLLFYIGLSILGTAQVVEGMTNKKGKTLSDILANEDHKQIEAYVKKMDDTLLVDKYRSDYEDVLVNLEEACNQNILEKLLSLSSNVKTSTGFNTVDDKTIIYLNGLYKLRDNLSSTMDYIDGKKSNENSSSLF